MLQSMGSQGAGHISVTELNLDECLSSNKRKRGSIIFEFSKVQHRLIMSYTHSIDFA